MESTFLDWPAPADAAACPRREAPAAATLAAPPGSVRGRIVLVEDQDDFRELLAELLVIEGYAVEVAANGREAYLRLKRAPLPDLILLDLMMPVMNGWGFLNARQSDPALAAIPVILLSAMDGPDTLAGPAKVPNCLTNPSASEA